MRARLKTCLVLLTLAAVALPGCRRGPYLADGGELKDGGDLVDTGVPVVDSGTPPVVDSGTPPEDAGDPPPPEDAGPEDAGPPEDAGDVDPPPVDAGPAGTPVRIGFTNAAISIEAGQCSGAYVDVPRLRVAVLDGPGNEVAVDADVNVVLSSDSETLRFYGDTTCSQNIGSITIPAGSSSRTLTVRDSNDGTYEVSGSATGYERGTTTITVTPP